ncbi:hypothetical protein LINPERHAP1_LOCUS15196 [Linum perenne]
MRRIIQRVVVMLFHVGAIQFTLIIVTSRTIFAMTVWGFQNPE